jgi:hypothetical protein
MDIYELINVKQCVCSLVNIGIVGVKAVWGLCGGVYMARQAIILG